MKIPPQKPKSMSWESFSERQIQQAQEEGQFDNILGLGQPIDLDKKSWVATWLKRNNLSPLTHHSELNGQMEKKWQKIFAIDSEKEVREEIDQMNREILEANLRVTIPSLRYPLWHPEKIVKEWKEKKKKV